MPPPSYGGPKLPSNLLDQVGGAPARNGRDSKRGGRGGRGGRPSAPSTRKDKRKLERDQKKQARVGGPQRRQLGRFDQPDDRDAKINATKSAPAKASKLASLVSADIEKPSKPTISVTAAPNKTTKEATPKPPTAAAPAPKVSEPRKISRRVQERLNQDDAEIAALEKKLGMKGGKLGKSFEDEGLADLLGDLDDSVGISSNKRKRSEDKAWLDSKRRRRVAAGVEEEEVLSSDDEEDDGMEDDLFEDGLYDDMDEEEEDGLHAETRRNEAADDDSEEGDLMEYDDGDIVEVDMDGAPPSEDSDDELVDEDEGLSEEDDVDDDFGNDGIIGEVNAQALREGSFADFGSEDEGSDEEETTKPVRENPYVAPGTSTEKPAGKYIPPSLRAPPSNDAELASRLKRQVQGLLNRLSEANILSILSEVEKLYQNNPRQYVTSTLIDLLLGLVCDRSALNETFMILHAGFIAAVYRVIGPDFGAQLLERLVESFDKYYAENDSDDASGKECTNLVSLLAQLYNLQVIGADLVFDYIRSFLDKTNELHTELLLRIVRSSGYQLRQDDPSALKDIVLLLQRTVAAADPATVSVRTKFMIDTINDLKNNKVKAGAAASAVTSEHLTRMRKTLGTLNNRNVKVTEPMRIGLHDIRDTEKRGKWWLVGASWKGRDQDVDQAKTNGSTVQDQDVASDADEESTTDLLVLARDARMNTDIRRAIFVTIMSATDYKDAHLKLLKLNLTRAQEVEIPRVLLHCAGAEKQYNPYYTLIARKLCGEHKLRMAFQFALWDFFKRMGERGEDDEEPDDEDEDGEHGGANMAVIVNYAKVFGNLIATGGLGLNVLKNLDLVYVQQKTRAFLEICLVTILLQAPAAGSQPTKKRSATTALPLRTILEPALAFPQIVSGLQYFLRKVVSKSDLTRNSKEKEQLRLACKDAIDFLATAGQDETAD